MRNLGEVGHVDFVGDGLTQCYGQLHLTFLELLGVQDALHRHDVRLLVWHLYTNRSLAGHRGDNTNAEGSKVQSDVLL